MGQYGSEAEEQYVYLPERMAGEGGRVRPELLDRLYTNLGLNERAQGAIGQFMTGTLWANQTAKVFLIGESDVKPWPDRGSDITENWTRYGNIWLLQTIEKVGNGTLAPKGVVARVAVIMKISGGSVRVTLMEVDDYLSDASGRMTQAELRKLVRKELLPAPPPC